MTTPIPFLLNEDDIIDGYAEEYYFRAHDLVITTSFETEKEAEQLKQQILSALKLQRLVEEEKQQLAQDGGTNTASDSWIISCYQTLERLLEESRGKK